MAALDSSDRSQPATKKSYYLWHYLLAFGNDEFQHIYFPYLKKLTFKSSEDFNELGKNQVKLKSEKTHDYE